MNKESKVASLSTILTTGVVSELTLSQRPIELDKEEYKRAEQELVGKILKLI